MAALGDRFRTAREARGLSLSDVAGQIHIRSVYLDAIEREAWSEIGAPVYVRGFLRTYARFLGIDAEEAVQRFNESAAPEPAPPVAPSAAAASTTAVRGGDGARRPVLGLLALAVALLLVGFVGWQYVAQTRGARSGPLAGRPVGTTGAAASAGPVGEAPGSPTPAASPSATPRPSPSPLGPDALAVRLTERSWLRVVVDGSVAMEGLYPAGTQRVFHGKTADVRAGNAGGVRILVGGRDAGPLGGSGDVVERAYRIGG